VAESPQLVSVHRFDEIPNAMLPIAFDVCRGAQGRSHHPVPDHQDAKVEPFEELLYDDPRANVTGGLKRGPQVFLTSDAYRDSTPMVPNERLHCHWKAELVGYLDGLQRSIDDRSLRDRDARTGQRGLGQVLVVGDLNSESRGVSRHRRLDAPLFRPPS
jgi:hypothetical protein